MDAKKFMAVFVVLVMALSATACIVLTDSDSQAVTLTGDTVTLDVDKDYTGNADQLAKLGITSASSWVPVTGEYNGYKLVLNNVTYETESGTALKVISSESSGNILYVDCNGTNKFVCKGCENGYTICIDAESTDTGICFIGSGEFTAVCDNVNAIESLAIYASFFGVKGCKLNAQSSDLVVKSSPTDNQVLSEAITITEDGGMEILDGAEVRAISGDIQYSAPKSYILLCSAGVAVFNENKVMEMFILEDSYLYAESGNVTATDCRDAYSIGAMISGRTEITDSTFIGTSGNVSASSIGNGACEGIKFRNTLDVENSTIIATAGDIYAKTLNVTGVLSIGLFNELVKEGTTEITDSLVFAYGGVAKADDYGKAPFCFSGGIINSNASLYDYKLTGSVVEVGGSEDSEYSYGFAAINNSGELEEEGILTIVDSEFNVYGATRALAVGTLVCKDPKWCEYENGMGEWVKSTPTDIIKVRSTAVFIGFNNYVCLKSSDEASAERIIERFTEDTYKLPECPFDAPEGKQFRCWSIDGKEFQPGTVINVEYYCIVTAVWDGPGPGPGPTPSGGSDTTVVVIFAVLVALVALAILLMIFVPTKK